jgi:hypothetical protein
LNTTAFGGRVGLGDGVVLGLKLKLGLGLGLRLSDMLGVGVMLELSDGVVLGLKLKLGLGLGLGLGLSDMLGDGVLLGLKLKLGLGLFDMLGVGVMLGEGVGLGVGVIASYGKRFPLSSKMLPVELLPKLFRMLTQLIAFSCSEVSEEQFDPTLISVRGSWLHPSIINEPCQGMLFESPKATEATLEKPDKSKLTLLLIVNGPKEILESLPPAKRKEPA